MIPRYSNPSSLFEQLEIVSRAALNGDEDDAPMEVEDVPFSDRLAMVFQLEDMLKKSLGDIQLAMGGAEESDESSRKKKRRKTEEVAPAAISADLESVMDSIPFRLVSNKLPPKPVVLQPKPPPVIKTREPAREDTTEEAELRASQAMAVAVDFDWILEQSKKVYVNEKKVTHVTAQLPGQPPAVMVAERPRQTPRAPHLCSKDLSLEVTPSPHSTRPTCTLPVVQVDTLDASHTKKKRRRKAREAPPRPPPMFWRPTQGIGGKSMGYAMGYSGSWALDEGDSRRYQYHRDTMKKATFVP